MGRLRFVAAETVRIPLSDGDWIDVKKRLTAAEIAQKDGGGVPSFRNVGGDGDKEKARQEFNLDFVALKLARIAVYVLAWSFADAKGNQTTPTREHVELLDEETVKEIDAALDKHVAAMEQEKNAQRPAPVGAGT